MHWKAKKRTYVKKMAACALSLGIMVPSTAWANKTPAKAKIITQSNDDTAAYDLGRQTVEASRPDWETKLSPGTVTIIRPDDYKGEQKELPDFLKMVPGVHVREVNGKGQYTTVTVRGSTAAQVGIFVDGVLCNLGGDAAVDISTIPIKNVERIEIYRGYIPSRFGGTYMGGVINIVTKKPTTEHTSIEIGKSEYGGKQLSWEMSAPVSKGSLMLGINYESNKGDFPYNNYAAPRELAESLDWYEFYKDWDAKEPADWKKKWLAYYKSCVQAESDTHRWRKYNDRKNTSILTKWQNDHWMVKASYNKLDRHLPDSLWGDSILDAVINNQVDLRDIYYVDGRRQKLEDEELLLQHRNTNKKLEWGWMIDYLHQNKEYKAEHILVGDDDVHLNNLPLRKWSKYRSNKYNGQIDGTYKINNRQMLDFQMNYSHERMNIYGSNMDKVLGDSDIANILGQMRNRYDQNILNFQVQDTIVLDKNNTWFITPSWRYNQSKITGYSDGKRFKVGQEHRYHWLHPKDEQTDGRGTWQIALKKIFNNHFTMRMTGGTYYRLLNMYEIAGDGAGILPSTFNGRNSVFPQPEQGKQFDMSAIWKGKALGADSNATITYFWRSADRMLQLVRAGLDYSSYFNDNRGTIHGFELQNRFKWHKFALDLRGTYTKVDPERKNTSVGYGYSSIWPTYQPEWEGNMRLTCTPTNQFAVFGEMHYTGKYYTYYGKDYRGGEYAELSGKPANLLIVVNSGIKWKPHKNMLLTFGCNDILDQGPKQKIRSNIAYTVPGYVNDEFPLQGRTYYATLKYEF
ncbi:TonB-dependent receptor plug domain-containing protein [Pectinatus sottacetonis]|uniref:TonB-dependent receptor plug domain-containing protein n=1 Tax=Pectinatus sottacetonis TaxID=1002795 RepID=UPI0018C6BF3F|nr:TonB-dependent receptor plug domain-containing protein [Pectinatus sottacetonis]